MTKTNSGSLIAVVTLSLISAVSCGNSSSPSAPATNPGANAAVIDAAPATPSAPAVPMNDHDAIAAAIRTHLASNSSLNMAAMELQVNEVTVTGDQAQADAVFHLKQGGASMEMTYSLQRHGSGWLVSHSQPAGGQFAHPPMDKTHAGIGSPHTIPKIQDFFPNGAPDPQAPATPPQKPLQ